MKVINYKDLAKLRLRDFIGDSPELYVEESGMQVVVGLGGFERLGNSDTSFGWRQGEAYATAEVTLEFGPGSAIPEEVANRILKQIGLPIQAGMTGDELIQVLGPPNVDKKSGSERSLQFVCGDNEPYLIGCTVDDDAGLNYLFIARKDYCDEDAAL